MFFLTNRIILEAGREYNNVFHSVHKNSTNTTTTIPI